MKKGWQRWPIGGGDRAATTRYDGQGSGGPLRRRKGGGPRGGREGGMRSYRGGAATIANDEGSATAGPCANPSAACGCGQRRVMVLDQRKRGSMMENIKLICCKEWQVGNLVQNQSFAAGESWVGGAAGIQHRAKLLFVEVPRYLRTLWLAFYFLQQPQHFRSQTKQTLRLF